MLVFTVLCLTVFSLISYAIATNEKALAEAEAQLVTRYYEADAFAERVLAEILDAEFVPESALDVEIISWWDWDIAAEIASFSCPVYDTMEILVEVAIYTDTYEILSWRMWDSSEWEADLSINVWLGPDGAWS